MFTHVICDRTGLGGLDPWVVLRFHIKNSQRKRIIENFTAEQ